jgi:hypothetical protein
MAVAAQHDADAWIRSINERDSFRTEFREVLLQLGKPGRSESSPHRTLRIMTLRAVEGDRCRTVFYLAGPWPLTGTAYLLEEQRGRLEPFGIHLHLPFGLRRVIRVDPARRGQGHLGSDFTYDDLKYWLPLEGFAYRHEGEPRRPAGSALLIRGEITLPELAAALGYGWLRMHVDRETRLVHSIEYGVAGESERFRVFTADRFRQADGNWIPGRMQILNDRTGHESTLLLQHAWYDRPVPASVFLPEKLPSLGGIFRQAREGHFGAEGL